MIYCINVINATVLTKQVPDPPKVKKEDVLWNQATPASARLQLDSGKETYVSFLSLISRCQNYVQFQYVWWAAGFFAF